MYILLFFMEIFQTFFLKRSYFYSVQKNLCRCDFKFKKVIQFIHKHIFKIHVFIKIDLLKAIKRPFIIQQFLKKKKNQIHMV